MFKIFRDPEMLETTSKAFAMTTGSMTRPLRPQAVSKFLKLLYPEHLILDGHVKYFLRQLDANCNSTIKWAELAAVSELKEALDDDETAAENQASMATRLQGTLR